MESVLPFLYSLVAIIGAAGYIPQIVSLIQTRDPSYNISISTWLIWSSSWVISLLYGIVCLSDLLFCIIATVNLTGCLSVLLLVVHNRRTSLCPVLTQPPHR